VFCDYIVELRDRLPDIATPEIASCRPESGVWETAGARRGILGALTIFGLFAVAAMLVFYALEDRNPWYILAFAGACVLGSAYGFLQGAWPFGVVEADWAVVAVRRWRSKSRSSA
jgi:hypothetical protein